MAQDIVTYLKTRLKKQEKVNIAVSGGSTPAKLFQALVDDHAGQPFWDKVEVFWVDERCVDPADPESNFGNARSLLTQLGISKAHMHPMFSGCPREICCRNYARLLELKIEDRSDGMPILDLVLLGLGEDGHTASLFPGKNHSLETNICSLEQHPNTRQWRISMSLATINSARRIIFFVLGENKAEIVARVLSGQEGAVLPANQVKSDHVSWYLDKAAARDL